MTNEDKQNKEFLQNVNKTIPDTFIKTSSGRLFKIPPDIDSIAVKWSSQESAHMNGMQYISHGESTLRRSASTSSLCSPSKLEGLLGKISRESVKIDNREPSICGRVSSYLSKSMLELNAVPSKKKKDNCFSKAVIKQSHKECVPTSERAHRESYSQINKKERWAKNVEKKGKLQERGDSPNISSRSFFLASVSLEKNKKPGNCKNEFKKDLSQQKIKKKSQKVEIPSTNTISETSTSVSESESTSESESKTESSTEYSTCSSCKVERKEIGKKKVEGKSQKVKKSEESKSISGMLNVNKLLTYLMALPSSYSPRCAHCHFKCCTILSCSSQVLRPPQPRRF